MGDSEGRYYRQIGEADTYDYRYRNPSAIGKGVKKIIDLLLHWGQSRLPASIEIGQENKIYYYLNRHYDIISSVT